MEKLSNNKFTYGNLTSVFLQFLLATKFSTVSATYIGFLQYLTVCLKTGSRLSDLVSEIEGKRKALFWKEEIKTKN